MALADSAARTVVLADQLAPPALDGVRHVPEGSPLVGQLVGDAHRWPGLDVAQDQTASLELLQPGREHFVSRALGLLGELAEAERPGLEHVQDQRGPRPAQHIDRLLKRSALGVHGFRHPPHDKAGTFFGKGP